MMNETTDIIRQLTSEFLLNLKRGKISGSYPVALETANLCRNIVANTRWVNAKNLIQSITRVGKILCSGKPEELVIGNIVRRVLFIIREEYSQLSNESDEKEKEKEEKKSLERSKRDDITALRRNQSKLLNQSGMFLLLEEEHTEELLDQVANLKTHVLEGIKTLLDELDSSYEDVSGQAIEHIHASEVIMTFGRSRTVETFLKAAGKKRNFQLIVVESAPSFNGRETAEVLSKEGIDTTLIPDSAIYAMMSRVNKVIIGTHAVMANGGLIAQAGTHIIAQAAHYHSVPILVCTALYKLCPIYPSGQDLELLSPVDIMNFEDVAGNMADVSVINPAWDYIAPELVSLFVTNTGGYMPSYTYRLLAEFYNPMDEDVSSF